LNIKPTAWKGSKRRRQNPFVTTESMTEYFIFFWACNGLALSLIGLWLWLEHHRRA
jgi:hypothetical protein